MLRRIAEYTIFGIAVAVVLGGLLVLIPATPGIILWFFLHPEGFWEKFAWFIVSLILYIVVLLLEAEIAVEIGR